MTPGQRNNVRRIDAERRGLHAVTLRRAMKARRSGRYADAFYRPALIAYLTGLRQTVVAASRAIGRDVRTAHYELDRADDRRDDAEIRERIAWLGLTRDAVDGAVAGAERIAGRAAQAIITSGGNIALLPASPDVFGTFGRANVPDSLLDTWAETVAYSEYERGRGDAGTIYPAVRDALWGYRWSSILDNRTTQGCKTLDGWVAPLDDAWVQALRPPRHWKCRAVLVEVWQSSALSSPPKPMGKPSEATLMRLLAEKERFLRAVA